MILIRDLNKYYRSSKLEFHALKNININIEKGEFVSIVGKSGSGKSTLLNVIGLLDTYDSGSYTIDGISTQFKNELQVSKLRKKHIGFIFQSFNLLPYKTAIENVALPLMYHGINKKKRNNAAIKVLETLGLESHLHNLPSQLSGGQQQRVAIARAIVTEPNIILADEPTGSLDSFNTNEIMQTLKDIAKVKEVTIVIVTHDDLVSGLTDRNIYLEDVMVA